MTPHSLLQQAASCIADHPELYEQLKREAPYYANRDVGFQFCKKRLRESWVFALCESPLQESHLGRPLGVGDKMRGLSFRGSSTKAVSVTLKGILSWWETYPYAHCLRSENIGYEGVTGFSVSADGKMTALVAGNKVSLWTNDEYQQMRISEFELDEQGYSVFCTPTRLVVGGARGKIWIWNIQKIRTERASCITTMIHDRLEDRLASLNKIHALYVTSDGSRCISALNKNIKVLDMATGQLLKTFDSDCSALIAKVYFQECAWDHATKSFTDVEIMSCFTDGTLVLTRVSDETVTSIKISNELLASCVPSADGKFLLTGSRKDSARLWERHEIGGVVSFQEVQNFIGHNVNTQIAFRADSAAVLIGNNSGGLSLWGINSSLTLDQAQKVLEQSPTQRNQ